jgi:N-acetylmuramoyl-L-alanine amidase
MLPVQAAQISVNGVRVWSAPDHTRLVFDTAAPVAHRLFTLDQPERLVIDVENALLEAKLPTTGKRNRLIRRIRSSVRAGQDVRVVLDLKSPIRAKSFMLKPNEQYGHRLVIDLEPKTTDDPRPVAQVALRRDKSEVGRDLIIAIDAGHGGEDPGAKGPSGVFEKNVVMDIARKLAEKVDAEPGMKAVLIRTGDYYIGLRKRIHKAREERADLFVSIHADAFRDPKVGGASVYTLSQRGASSEAAHWLAEKENSADLVGGIDLEDKDDLLASVLLDLSMSATMQASREAADDVLRQLRKLGKTHKRSVQYAGFQVLKAPDIPSMLVETAFISNPDEESHLKDAAHQDRLAVALLKGIRNYFRTYPPSGTWMAQNTQRKHVISYGDTLSTIAKQYQVSLAELRTANNLRGDRIRVGQVLSIPES